MSKSKWVKTVQKRPKRKIELIYTHVTLPVDFPAMAFVRDTSVFPVDRDTNITLMHLHNCIELGHCYEGSGYFYIEDRTYTISAGDTSIICPYTMHISKHRWDNPDSQPSQWEYLFFDPQRLLGGYFPEGFPGSDLFLHDLQQFPSLLTREEYPQVYRLTLAIFDEFRHARENYQDAVRGLILALLVEVARHIPHEASEPAIRRTGWQTLAPAIRYINENYMDLINLTDLATLCHISVTYFRRRFSQLLGVKPVDYIHSVRIRKACELLASTEMPILDVAMQVGFRSVSSFNRCFREINQDTPFHWRNKVRVIKKDNIRHIWRR
jgi:AraC family transcriptional regulator, activator of mtrCDE